MPVVMIKSDFPRCAMLQPPPFKVQKSTLTALAKVLNKFVIELYIIYYAKSYLAKIISKTPLYKLLN